MAMRVLQQLLQATTPVNVQVEGEGECTQYKWEGASRAGIGCTACLSWAVVREWVG